MKLKLPLAAVFVAALSLSACGGGGGGSSNNNVVVASPAALTKTDATVGTGAEAATGKTATVSYTGWLYSDTAAEHKGTQFDKGSFSFVLGANQVISGFEQGVLGMKVGGKRTLLIPSNLGYGASGKGAVPPNAGLVFEVELTAVK